MHAEYDGYDGQTINQVCESCHRCVPTQSSCRPTVAASSCCRVIVCFIVSVVFHRVVSSWHPQADVALLQYPLGVEMDPELAKNDLDYYTGVVRHRLYLSHDHRGVRCEFCRRWCATDGVHGVLHGRQRVLYRVPTTGQEGGRGRAVGQRVRARA